MRNPATPRLSKICSALLAFALVMGVLPVFAQDEPPANTETLADQQAAHKVEASLDKQPALTNVKADVDGGVATLSGQVRTEPDRQQAATIAADTPGIKKVQNQTTLDPDLSVRFSVAMDDVKNKLVQLIANLPLLAVAILIVMLSVWLGGVLGRRLHIINRISNRNPYMEGLLRSIVRALVILAGVLLALNLLGITSLVGAVLGSAGVVGLVLGFAFKDIAENYVAGIMLTIRRPFNPGEMVRIDSYEGRVVALTSRATQLMTVEGNHLQIPNGVVFKSVLLNYSRNPKRRFDFSTNVATGRSWHDAMDIGIATMGKIDGVLDDPAPSALIQDLANDAATLRFMGWIDQTQNDLSKTRSEAMRLVRRALRDAGLTPPNGVQNVQITRDVSIHAGAAPTRESGESRDTSVDHTLDDQIEHTESEDGKDLLRPQDPPKTG